MKCYWLMNHMPTEVQMLELKKRFGVSNVIFPDASLSEYWKNLPCDLEVHGELLDNWIGHIKASDIAVVQGECTYSFYVVDVLLAKGVRVFSAVSTRVVEEQNDGEITKTIRTFKHQTFREYKRAGQ